MLVLTRKQNESIVVDGQITIRILRISGNRIRLGIDAPSDIAVRRQELEPLALSNVSDDCRISEMERSGCRL